MTIYIQSEQNCQKQTLVQVKLFLFFGIVFYFILSNCKIRQLIWDYVPPKSYLPMQKLLYPCPISFIAIVQSQAHDCYYSARSPLRGTQDLGHRPPRPLT